MSSPIPTRHRAVIPVVPPVFLFAGQLPVGPEGRLYRREPLFIVAFVSTGRRHCFNQAANIDSVVLDFWEDNPSCNGPHHSVEVIIPTHWPCNLFLCALAKSIRESNVISVHSTQLFGRLSDEANTINSVHHLFSLPQESLKEMLHSTADLGRAFGGDT